MSSYLYVPSQAPLLHLGLDPEQALSVPHLHTPESQVSVVSEQSRLSVHSAIERN